MADEQLRGLNINQVYIDEAVGMFPDLTTYRTDWENIDAPRELVSVDYRRRMINEMLATYGKIFPTPEKEQKKEIKRGNPWVQ